ncbi:MAG: urate hydroxylase PuuD, partial [Gemmatimonadota bacterium]
KIIAAVAAGTAPDASLVALAGLRSRHNTYMSVPLLFTMISSHYPGMYAESATGYPGLYRALCMAGVLALGFLVVRWLYAKSAKVTTAV